MQLKIAQVIGLNTDQKASQVNAQVQDKENAFFGLLTLECDDAFTRGRQTLSEIADLYFDFDGNPSQKLSEVLKALNEKLTDISHFDFILGSLSGKVFYLLGKGDVEVYLKREGKISQLLSVSPPSDLISGFLQANDRVLLSTKNLTTFLADDLSEILNLEIDSFEGEISDRITGGTLDGDGLSGLLIEVEGAQVKAEIPSLDQEVEKIEEGPVLDRGDDEPIPSKINLKSISSKALGSLKLVFTNIYKIAPKSGKGRLILAVFLIVTILIGAFFQFKSSQEKEKNNQFNQLFQAAMSDFEAAKGLSSLNAVESKAKLELAKESINKALVIKPKESKALEFKNKLDAESGSILQQFTASEFPVFLDLDLIKKGFSSQNMSLSTGKILLLDLNAKTLVLLDIAKKSNQILAGESQLGKAQFASINGSIAFVYSEDEHSSLSGKGIVRIDSTNQKVTTVAKADKDLGIVADISGFASNVYILDSLKGQIWKYLPTEGGYSDKREYLTAGTKVDLANSIKMQIESSVYVLQKDGVILRFTRGTKDHFAYEGLDKGVSNPKSFFVSSDTDNLYVLDSGNSRILILTKTGGYKGQINGDKFGTATDLVVDEKEKKVYLLEGSKIYTVDLK